MLDYIPNELETYLIVIVNQDMPHPTDKMPLSIRVCFFKLLRHLIYRFSNALYIICDSMAANLISFKLLISFMLCSKLKTLSMDLRISSI